MARPRIRITHHVVGNDVDDEHVASPRRYHVEVAQRAARGDQQGARVHRLHPQVEGEDQSEDGHRLVIVRAAHRTRDVRGNQTHERRRQERRVRAARRLVREEVGGNGRGGGKDRSDENAHVAHLHEHGEKSIT